MSRRSTDLGGDSTGMGARQNPALRNAGETPDVRGTRVPGQGSFLCMRSNGREQAVRMLRAFARMPVSGASVAENPAPRDFASDRRAASAAQAGLASAIDHGPMIIAERQPGAFF